MEKYNIIIHPKTFKKYKLNSIKGNNLLNNYYNNFSIFLQNGGKSIKIGDGASGCVISPPLCSEKKNIYLNKQEDIVAKIFPDGNFDFNNEKRKNKLIQRFIRKNPKYKNHFILFKSGVNTCNLKKPINKDIRKLYKKCDISLNRKRIYKQLLYPKAECDLEKYIKDIKKITDIEEFNKQMISFYKNFVNVIEGVTVLNANSISHHDIKMENILVFKEGNKIFFKIADFGLTLRYKDVYSNSYCNGLGWSIRKFKKTHYTPVLDSRYIAKYLYRKFKIFRFMNKVSEKEFYKNKEFIKKNLNKYIEGYDVYCLGSCFKLMVTIERNNKRKNKMLKFTNMCKELDILKRATLKEILSEYRKFLKTL